MSRGTTLHSTRAMRDHLSPARAASAADAAGLVTVPIPSATTRPLRHGFRSEAPGSIRSVALPPAFTYPGSLEARLPDVLAPIVANLEVGQVYQIRAPPCQEMVRPDYALPPHPADDRCMELAKIWLATIALSVAYGITHDLVTAHVCVEYFTIGHEDIFGTDNSVLLALGWGTVATWWVGLVLGGFIAIAAQMGPAPRISLADLLRPAALLLGITAASAIAFGVTGYTLARIDAIALGGVLAMEVPASSQDRFMANAWAHTAAYGVGAVGALVLCGWIVAKRLRARPAARPLTPHARSA